MNILLALDSAMLIFNNVPPRVNYCEFDLQLPCHHQYFEVSSYAEMLQHSMFPLVRTKLIDAFQRLFLPQNEVKPSLQNEIMCCWDMLYLIHGTLKSQYGAFSPTSNLRNCHSFAHLLMIRVVLFTHCWQHLLGNPLNRTSPSSVSAASSTSVFVPMKMALANWKMIWDDIRVAMPRSMIHEMGFETSADSYWTLTTLILQRFEGKSAQGIFNDFNGSTNSNDDSSESAGSNFLDFMPLEVDCDSHGAHLRKILGK